MSNSIAYIDSNLLAAVVRAAQKRFGITQIGLIMLQNHKKTYKKAGIEVASDVLDFVIFDAGLHKIGVIKRSDIKKETTKQTPTA
ncbi:hypothetical protein [Gracilimonas tropica]|uniref:hypothetical protein n=1 Tax=Gracilimonas tropica TaxID=454600 RepID=UPI000362C8AC|nr:hypothetical protein [Gracilimonas tropica]